MRTEAEIRENLERFKGWSGPYFQGLIDTLEWVLEEDTPLEWDTDES